MNKQIATYIRVLLLAAGVISASVPAEAQVVRFSVEVDRTASVTEPDMINLDRSDSEMEHDLINTDGEIIGRQTAGCIRITSRENIPVLVTTHFDELERGSDRKARVTVEPRYINDGGECPQNPELAARVSKPFANGIASFTLFHTPQTIRNIEGVQGRLRAYLTVLGKREYESPIPGGEATINPDTAARGVFTIHIEYL